MKRGLIVGGTSRAGVGAACYDWLLNDERFSEVVWHVTTPKELDVSRSSDIHTYLMNVDLGDYSLKPNEFDGYDYVLYAAGLNELRYAEDESIDHLSEIFAVNVFGFISLLGQLRAMFPGRPFSAVAIVSDAMRTPMRGSVAYCASKAALAMAVRTLAREFAPSSRVNGVAPGVVEGTTMSNYIDETVPGFRGWSKDQARKYEQSGQPFKRRVGVSEVAEVVANVLYGPDYMSGSIVEITGAK